MDIQLNKEDQAFQKEVHDFIRDNWTNAKATDPLSRYMDWVKALVAKGWTVQKWPKEHGGTGWNTIQHYIWQKETSVANAPGLPPFGVSMVGPIIYTYGNETQKKQHLPGIVDQSVRWCQGYSEPGAGSDLAALKTKAELTPDGKHYIVNGSKIWTTMAHTAHWMFCLTRTDNSGKKQEGITFLLMDMADPGIEVKPIITLGGNHHVNTVHFTNVKVPVENRIGDEGKGWTYAKGLLQHERTGLAGITRSAMALQDLKDNAHRIPDGNGTLADNRAYQMKLARLEIDLQALEFLELRTMITVSEGKAPGPESSILKLKGTQAQQAIAEITMESAGYYASPWGNPVGLKFGKGAMNKYLDGRASTIYGGASEVQRDVIAKRVLGL